ncbi:bacteriophage capsid protein [Gluconacetobacter johannae DSM 13595]|nr:phage portal protein [Gluconacetobacter johannae]GBQ84126.1 bacteriophage capsid protein [Gluconacetobacter johannae DSM 13595]
MKPGLLSRIRNRLTGSGGARAGFPMTLPGSWMGGMGGGFAYDGANMLGSESAEWNPWLRSPDAEINLDRDRMVARARDLFRNDGWARGSITRIADNVVGSQFRLVAKPDYRALTQRYGKAFDAVWAQEFRQAVEAEWRMWSEDPLLFGDAARKLTVTQIFRLAFMHQMKDGETIAVLRWMPERKEEGADYATTLQLIHPDRLSNPYQQLDTHWLRGGVEVDDDGAHIAYHIRQAHQYDYFDAVESMIWDRIPRFTPWGRPIVVHSYDFDDAGQHRGLSAFTPVLNRFRMLARYDQAELQQALTQTIFATFVQSPYDPEDVRNGMEDGELSEYQKIRQDWHKDNPLTLGGVRIPVMPPGEEVKTVASTRPNSGFDAFQGTFLRNFAAAIGTSAEQLSMDYSKTNYSSSRSSMLEMWKTMHRRRNDFAVSFANPTYGGFLEEAFDQGRVPLPRNAPDFLEGRAAYARCSWIGPGRGWVDPVSERQGAVLGLDAGFGTLERECAEQGLDYEEVLDQRRVERQMMTERGLPFPQWAVGAPAGLTTQKPDPT